MQPKCSQTNMSSASTNTNPSTSAQNQSNLLIPCERFKELCLRHKSKLTKDLVCSSSSELSSLIEYFFEPEKDFFKFLSDFDLLKLYITGGIGLDAFKSRVKQYDSSSVCGLVWNVNYVAYRCRTCALSPCMSICADCFRLGDHKGHDFNMFRSGAGGACDCGDECVMNPKGFCKSHGSNSSKSSSTSSPPDDLMICCEYLLPSLLYRLLQYFRNVFASNDFNLVSRTQTNLMLNDIQIYLDFINELCSFGTPTRKVLVDFLLSREFYEKKIQLEQKKSQSSTSNTNLKSDDVSSQENSDEGEHINLSISLKQNNYKQDIFLRALNALQRIQVPQRFENIANELCHLNSSTMLDEFLFWCIRFEFPESLVKYLLSLLPDLAYKETFIKAFVSHYSYISKLLLNSKSEHLASRVVHISVQLFSNEAMAMKALEESNLLPIILATLYNMIVTPYNNTDEDKLLIDCKSENELTNKHKVIDPDHPIMQENLYWLFISDLVNLLSHKQIALEFLQNENLTQIWLELISYFQVMNLNVRKFGEHIQQEQPTYFSSFSAELEFCSSILWSFLQHLKSPDQLALSKRIVDHLLDSLHKWLVSIDLISSKSNQIKRPNPKHLTFHLPLHRYYAAFIYNSLYEQSASLDYLLASSSVKLSPNLLADILAYPLQLQIGFHEIHANMWVRNGMQMKGQAMTYVQNHFCTSFSDADLFLVQVLASRLDPNLFMNIFFERFHLIKWLKSTIKNRHKQISQPNSAEQQVASVVEEMLDEFESTTPQSSTNIPVEEELDYLDQAHQVAMLVGSLTVLAQIVTIKPNLSFKSYSLTRTEVVNLLCVLDRTYSQIDESMPDVCSLSQAKRYIPSILEDVADFLQPSLDVSSIGNLKQGRYKPKDSIWINEYDPLYTMLRSVKRREFQESFDRYSQFVERKFSNKKIPKNIWPPFRLPKLEIDLNQLSASLSVDSTNDEDFNGCTQQELINQQRLSNELDSKSKILNSKSLHAILITILYEHYYTNPVVEKILYFTIYILELALHYSSNEKKENSMDIEDDSASSLKFDELNFETWFKSNSIRRNICTFVPFVTKKYEPVQQTDASEDDTKKSVIKVPPFKRICARDDDDTQMNTSDDESTSTIKNSKTGETFQLKKSKKFESILSLLVKIYFKNRTSEINETYLELKFLSSKSSFKQLNEDEIDFKSTRIGNEDDYIYNLLEKAAQACEKCRTNIEKSLESLNNQNKKFPLDSAGESGEIASNVNITTSASANTVSSPGTSASSPSSASLLDAEFLKNKKLKAKQRQQRILAQMSSSQQAFLQNPSNKLDVEAYKEAAAGTSPQKQSTITSLKEQLKEIDKETTESSTSDTVPSTSKPQPKEANERQEEYECCICRLSETTNLERPLGAVTLLQATSILAHRESKSINEERANKKLPLNDDTNYKQLQTETLCWKQEESRVKIMREMFTPDSCKYSINIGWKGGVYAQMCGHYLHFDCYNSYKKSLEENINRFSNVEYSCPLCRQVSNCVLPIIPFNVLKQANSSFQPPGTISSSSLSVSQSLAVPPPPPPPPFNLATSTIPNSPAKMWILSSLADKQQQVQDMLNLEEYDEEQVKLTSLSELEQTNKQILHLLKTRPFSTPEFSSKTLTQCKNDALAVITLTTPYEFRYIDQWNANILTVGAAMASPIDDDIAMFTSSVLRTQLEIDLMLKEIDDSFIMTNLKKRRTCFFPLYDVISTHCRLMCHEQKPHVRLWLMLTNPVLLAEEISSQFIKIKLKQFEKSDIQSALSSGVSAQTSQLASDDSSASKDDEVFNKNKHKPLVPTLCRDPIACLLLLMVNLPTNVPKSIFTNIVQAIFNMVYIQNLIYLCREFDEQERNNWSNNNTILIRWNTFKDYVANIINGLKKTNLINRSKNETINSSYYVPTIWSLESAKNYVRTKCLHFLKIASLLQYYLYDTEINFSQINSFDYLIKYLSISYCEDGVNQPVLKWALQNPFELINVWLDELITASLNYPHQMDTLYSIKLDEYFFPSLLELPYLYSDLFGYYSTKKCQFCSKIPKETGICLVCGVQFCYKNNYCCDSMKEFNKKHLNFCGAQTLVLLNINSTYVFVIRGKRCAPWASLYLDEHGEEDRDLKRGKPLYLNRQRYNLLQSTWRTHSFDYQSLKWYNASLFIY